MTFSLLTITNTSPTSLLLEYSSPPLAISSLGLNDSLNPNNFTLVGPTQSSVSSITPVAGDSKKYTLALTTPISTSGTYILSVANVQSATNELLTAPTSLSFIASNIDFIPSIASGAENDESSEAILRKNLSPALKGPNFDALIAAIASGDEYLKNLAIKVFKQLFVSTAEGKYLDRKASDNGLTRPSTVGISDSVFRELAIKITANKLTIQSFLEILEAYYGAEATRATIDTTVYEPYALVDGDDLIVETGSRIVTVVFHTNDFTSIGAATAVEVAAVISRSFQLNETKDWGEPVRDNITGTNLVRMFSGALGLRGSFRILGGRAQNILKFPTLLSTTQTVGTQWTISSLAALPGRARYTFVGGTNPSLQLVNIGDITNVYGTPFNVNNRGSFEIVNVVSDIAQPYFEIMNLDVFGQVGIPQVAANDITFYRPTKFTVNSKDRFALAAQGNTGYTDVILAATTAAIERHPFEAAYLHSNSAIIMSDRLEITGMTRTAGSVSVTTSTSHGLLSNDTFYLTPGEYSAWGDEFNEGIKTVDSIVGPTEFIYLEAGATSPLVATTFPQYAYPCYRNSSGIVTIHTGNAHGLATGQDVIIENLKSDTAETFEEHSISGASGGSINLDYSASVVLQDGRILLCGGTPGPSLTTQIYNPATNSWANAANMNVARSSHTATLLNNGRVLITGGGVGFGVASCEIYDVNLDIWILVASMSGSRVGHTATLLNDGRVFVNGGNIAGTSEIYDISTGAWTAAASPSTSRFFSQATKLNDGRVLVCGGSDAGATYLDSTEVYTPMNDTWILASPMSIARRDHRSLFIETIGTSGGVLAIGGRSNAAAPLNTIEIFNPFTLSWSPLASFTTPRWNFGATTLSDKTIMIQGGETAAGVYIDEYSIYNPLTNTWSNNIYTGPEARSTHNIFQLSNNDVVAMPSVGVNTERAILYPSTYRAGGLNGEFSVTVGANPKVFTYSTAGNLNFTKVSVLSAENASVYSMAATEDSSHIGPYLWDIKGGCAITGVSTVITQDLRGGQNYSSILVGDTTGFSDSGGYIVLDFGGPKQVSPIKYKFKISTTELVLDTGYTFLIDLPTGTSVTLLDDKGAFIPTNPEALGSFYVTNSIAGRIAAGDTIDKIAAAGVDIHKIIEYPGSVGLGNGDLDPNAVGNPKINDIVEVFGSDAEVVTNREGG